MAFKLKMLTPTEAIQRLSDNDPSWAFSSPFPGAAQGGSPESPVTASCRREMIKRVLMRFKFAAFAFANPYEFSKPDQCGL